MPDEQQSLFTASEQRALTSFAPSPVSALEMSQAALQAWKSKIAKHQQRLRDADDMQQSTLFESRQAIDPSRIDPFRLEVHNFFFFNWPADRHPGEPCIYFVIDTSMPLLLYVGETCKANQRWKGVHDCKQYVLNYQSLHFKHQLPTTINTAFWWDTPVQVRPRQQLESALIARWKSPFNKENWRFWGTPFISELYK